MKTPDPEILDLTAEELLEWRDRVLRLLPAPDSKILLALLAAYLYIRQALSAAQISIARLRRLFGAPRTEKSRDVLPKAPDQGQACPDGDGKRKDRPRRKGHGKNGVAAYSAAQRILVRHDSFTPGCPCSDEYCDGKMYRLKELGQVLRVVGQAP